MATSHQLTKQLAELEREHATKVAQLEEENTKLKAKLAKAKRDIKLLRGVITKKDKQIIKLFETVKKYMAALKPFSLVKFKHECQPIVARLEEFTDELEYNCGYAEQGRLVVLLKRTFEFMCEEPRFNQGHKDQIANLRSSGLLKAMVELGFAIILNNRPDNDEENLFPQLSTLEDGLGEYFDVLVNEKEEKDGELIAEWHRLQNMINEYHVPPGWCELGCGPLDAPPLRSLRGGS